MPKVLSASSKLRTGLYKTGTSMFFTPSKLFEAQMTEVFDEVWPTVTAVKMLRWQVKGYYEEYCVQDNTRLTSKFVEVEDVTNRPNLYSTCIDDTWEDNEFRIAKNLLTNVVACYEGWVENILVTLGYPNTRRDSKMFQFPSTSANGYDVLLGRLTANGCADLITSYYDMYRTGSAHYRLDLIDNWFSFYRYFKECRNAIIHTGGQTTQRVIDAYNNLQHLTAENLDVKEVPQIFNSSLGEPIRLSLRGVVGFSQITIRIVSTLDVELIRAENADKCYVKRIQESVKGRQTIAANDVKKRNQINSISRRGSFKAPSDVEAAYRVLKRYQIVT